MLLAKNFDEIDATTIQSLVDAGATESAHLDFKRESYGGSDSDKKELLKDVSSFANCLGGHLVIGVDEDDGAASALTPLSSADVDAELLRLESIVRTGIEPTIVGLRMKRIDVGAGSLIVIQIPRSFNPPHRVVFKNSNRYFSRNSAGCYELSLDELRMLFGEKRSVEERAKAFIGERFLSIQSGDGAMPIPLGKGALIMHLIPLSDLGANRRIEVSALREQHSALCPIGASGFSWRINLDGLNVYRGGEICHGYTQIFRNGAIEATSASIVGENNSARYLPSLALPEKLMRALNSYLKALRRLEASPPILLQLSFSGMQGVRLGVDPRWIIDEPPPYERETLQLPASIIAEYRDDDNYEAVIAEQMDLLWNVFDFEKCFYFDEEGKWIGEGRR